MVIYLIGTKAQYIKMAPVVLESIRRGLSMRVVYTGQHSETFEDLQENFGLPDPDHVLVSGGEAKDHGSFAHWLWAALRACRQPDARTLWREGGTIVVHGDTASTLLGAWIGWRYGLRVAHVEAGLRSFRYFHPFPEELVRVMVSRVARLHFCPNKQALANLQKAGVHGQIVLTFGNTMKDALRVAHSQALALKAPKDSYAVFSMHRHENLFNRARLEGLLDSLRGMANIIPVKFVLHPVTLKRLLALNLMEKLAAVPGLELVSRMDFLDFASLLTHASFVATDGGSNQEECAMLGIPCLLLRQATERTDGLDGGVVLSNYDFNLMMNFARRHAAPPTKRLRVDDQSPSSIIVDSLLMIDKV